MAQSASSISNAEPKPNWKEAADTLGWLWPFHIYFFASLFTLLALLSTVALFLTRSLRRCRGLSTIMMTSVFLLAVNRSVFLLTDPYLSRKVSTSPWWVVFCVIMTGLGATCLTASMTTLLYIAAISTNITHHHRVHLGRTTAVITACHFAFLINSNLLVTFVPKAHVMLIICQTTFAVWGLVISVGFAILMRRMRNNARANFEQASFNPGLRQESEKLRRLTWFFGTLSGTGACFFLLRIYEALDGIRDEEFSDTLSWWGLQTALRSLEIINAIILMLVFKNWMKRLVGQNDNVVREKQARESNGNQVGESTTNATSHVTNEQLDYELVISNNH